MFRFSSAKNVLKKKASHMNFKTINLFLYLNFFLLLLIAPLSYEGIHTHIGSMANDEKNEKNPSWE